LRLFTRRLPLTERISRSVRTILTHAKPVTDTFQDKLDAILERIDTQGWVVVPSFLSEEEACALATESRTLWENGDFRRAGIGRGENLTIREDIRRDHVMWLDGEQATAAQKVYLDRLDEVRIALNRRFFLGLHEFEGHIALYPVGGFYKAHLDRHRGSQDRVVTAILYLNENWQPSDGGQLKLWTTPGVMEGPTELVEPRLGTLVCFMAGDHWHEVQPAEKPRLSVTGWFRTR
jgi:SM-20-related protein